MHIIAILFGLLLLLFGGGCTLIFLITTLGDPQGMFSDMALLLQLWIPLGLVPLVGGWFLFQYGMRRGREKSAKLPTPNTNRDLEKSE
jgi:hypothetical protein